MNTAQRILAAHKTETYAQAMRLESEARELAVKVGGPNCYDTTWTFHDGSAITKTRDGYAVGEGK